MILSLEHAVKGHVFYLGYLLVLALASFSGAIFVVIGLVLTMPLMIIGLSRRYLTHVTLEIPSDSSEAVPTDPLLEQEHSQAPAQDQGQPE